MLERIGLPLSIHLVRVQADNPSDHSLRPRQARKWSKVITSLCIGCTQSSELVGLVVIGLVGQPVGLGLVWSHFLIGLVWFGLYPLVLLV